MAKRKKSAPVTEGTVLYPDLEVKVYVGEDALDAAEAKRLLQWVTESDLGIEFKNDYLLTDYHGNKIRCLANIGNRSYSRSNTDIYKQDILRGRWKLNGHSRIIGKTGVILSGQHVLTALVLADQQWNEEKEKWRYWSTPPTIDTFINFGLEETDDVKNTIDTARPTKLSDVLYRSIYLADVERSKKAAVSRLAEFAIQTVWDRTHRKSQASSRFRTHAESIAFVERHPKLMESIRFIFAEDASGVLKLYLNPGYAAGLHYLMGASATDSVCDDGTGYSEVDDPSEEQINFDRWDQANDFFVELLSDSESMKVLKQHFVDRLSSGTLTTKERVALLAIAWDKYAHSEVLQPEDLELEYALTPGGMSKLISNPITGGIDCGY